MIGPISKENSNDFRKSFKFPILLLEMFGFFPRIDRKSFKIKFDITLFKILYNIYTIIMFFLNFVVQIIYIINHGLNSVLHTSKYLKTCFNLAH